MAFTASTEARNAALNALGELLNGGFIRIYSGNRPATADDAPSGGVLACLSFGRVAFSLAKEGQIKANDINPDPSASGGGTAVWCRCFTSTMRPVIDGSIGAEITINSDIINQSDKVSCLEMTLRIF